MKMASKTDKGLQRNSNQDSYAVGELPGEAVWAVVCDGMGGANGGSVASTTAVKSISEQISSAYRPGMGSNSIRNLLQSAVSAANLTVFDMSKSIKKLAGMGTTVVTCMLVDSVAHIVHAGDSRAYLLSKGRLTQITRDHSIVQSMIESGHLTEAQARVHPRKNVITSALGVDDTLQMDYDEVTLTEGDAIFICTDGLTNYLETDEILSIVNGTGFYECPDALVKRANENGGGDNITVVLVAQ